MHSRKTWPEATKKKRESFRRFIFARQLRALARWRNPKFKRRRKIRMNWNEFRETPQRPWNGQVARRAAPQAVEYDPECYLCPGNARSQGLRNPAYKTTFVFENDFPALLPGVPEGKCEKDGLIVARTERGICRVVCFSPRHDLTIPRMRPEEVRAVVD